MANTWLLFAGGVLGVLVGLFLLGWRDERRHRRELDLLSRAHDTAVRKYVTGELVTQTMMRTIGGAHIPSTIEMFPPTIVIGPANKRTHARTVAVRILGGIAAFVPKRLRNEEIGDALEYLAAADCPRWAIYVKLISTLFWVGVNAIREFRSSVGQRTTK